MKKFINSKLFVAIVTAIIFTGIGVFAAGQILASSVTYNNTTVDLALDDLYDKVDNELIFGTPSYYASYGDADTTRNVSATVNKGKYLVLLYESKGFTQSTYTSSDRSITRNLVVTGTNYTVTPISGYFVGVHSTSNTNINNQTNSYILEAGSDNTVINPSITLTSTNDSYPMYLVLTVIPIIEE